MTALKPIFIVGMNGSGTTLVLDLLNHHPNIYGFPFETKVLPYFINSVQAGKYGNLNNDENYLCLWNDLRKSAAFIRANNGQPPPIPNEWRSKQRTLEAITSDIFNYFLSINRKLRVCEKTPVHVLHMDKLSELYPESKFIHVIRDGRACAASFHRRWGNDPIRTIYRWRQVVNQGRKQGGQLDNRYLEVRYEHLTSSPELSMRQICDFIDENFDERVLTPHRKVGLDNKVFGGTYKKIMAGKSDWKNYFSESQVKKIEAICGKTLSDFGYQPVWNNSDYEPSKLTISYWAYKEFLRFGMKGFFSAIKRKDKDALKRLYKKSQESLRAYILNKM